MHIHFSFIDMKISKNVLWVWLMLVESLIIGRIESTNPVLEMFNHYCKFSLPANVSHENINSSINKTWQWFSQFSSEEKPTDDLLEDPTTNTDLEIDIGNKLFEQHKFDEAAYHYSKVIAEKPNDALYLRNRSYCYIQLKKWDLALKDSIKAVEAEPTDLRGHYILGLTWLGLENFDEAIIHLQKARELAKWQREFCDTSEVTFTLWLARKKQWNKRKEEKLALKAELFVLLKKLIQENTNRKIKELLDTRSEPSVIDKGVQDRIRVLESEHGEYVDRLTSLFIEVEKKQSVTAIPVYFRDRISLELMREPVVTPSGITYDRTQIIEHLQKVGSFDPSTRDKMKANHLIPNNVLEEAIDAFLEENEYSIEELN